MKIDRTASAMRMIEIIAPTIEKYTNPNINGINEVMTANIDITVMTFSMTLLVLKRFIAVRISMITVNIAVNSGPKFPNPKGTGSKYENVSISIRSASEANRKIAP